MKRITFALILFLMACSHSKNESKIATPVRVQPVQEYTAGNQIRYSANIEPRQQVQLAFKSAGYVDSLLQVKDADGVLRNIQSGDFIKKGTTLAQLRKVDFESRVQQAKGQLGQANAAAQNTALQFDRAKKLLESESMTKSDFDQADAQNEEAHSRAESARAQLQEAEIALRDSDLKAPMDSIVVQRNFEVGDLASPGGTAFVVADITSVKGIFGVPDVVVSKFNIGQRLGVLLEAVPGIAFQGAITRISPAADQRNRLFETEISIPNPENRLRSGMIATIIVPPANAPTPVLVVPLTSIVSARNQPNHYAVMVVEPRDGKQIAELREIQLGETFGDRIAVQEGLQPGERVITVGATLVNAGDEVNVIP
jgi:RND family efflux transporter MFP subunit